MTNRSTMTFMLVAALCLALAPMTMAQLNSTATNTIMGTTPGNAFGSSVCSAGDFDGDLVTDILVGARGDDTAATDAGMMRVLSGADPSNVLLEIMGGASFDQFGYSVSCAGDVNGDNISDIMVSAPFADNNGPNSGTVLIFNGGNLAAGGTVAPGLLYTIHGQANFELLGEVVSEAGDLNDDGFDDVLISVRGFDNGRGAVRIISGIDGSQMMELQGDDVGDFYGSSVGRVGDVNGDKCPEIVIGAIGDDDGGNGSGSIQVYDVANATELFRVNGTATFEQFGANVSGAGDFDGDGLPDVIVGSPSANDTANSRVFTGEVKVLSGFDGTEIFAQKGANNQAQFGIAVSDAGDVNGDGFADVIAGTYSVAGNFIPSAGAATVIFGPDGSTAQTIAGAASYDFFGSSVAGMGDMNGDGFSDVIVGAYADHNASNQDVGSVRIFGANTHPVLHYHSDTFLHPLTPNYYDEEDLRLRWIGDGGDVNSVTGTVMVEGADGGQLGQIFVSNSFGNSLVQVGVGMEDLLFLVVGGANELNSFTFGFQADGTFTAPGQTRESPVPFLDNTDVFIQAFQTSNRLLESNGLRLRLTPPAAMP